MALMGMIVNRFLCQGPAETLDRFRLQNGLDLPGTAVVLLGKFKERNYADLRVPM